MTRETHIDTNKEVTIPTYLTSSRSFWVSQAEAKKSTLKSEAKLHTWIFDNQTKSDISIDQFDSTARDFLVFVGSHYCKLGLSTVQRLDFNLTKSNATSLQRINRKWESTLKIKDHYYKLKFSLCFDRISNFETLKQHVETVLTDPSAENIKSAKDKINQWLVAERQKEQDDMDLVSLAY